MTDRAVSERDHHESLPERSAIDEARRDSNEAWLSVARPPSVPCGRCGQPSGVPPSVVRANGGSGVICSRCVSTMTVDP